MSQEKQPYIDPEGGKVMVIMTPIGSNKADIAFVLSEKISDNQFRRLSDPRFVRNMSEDGALCGKIVSISMVEAYLNPEYEFEIPTWMDDIDINGSMTYNPDSDIVTYMSYEEMEAYRDLSGV